MAKFSKKTIERIIREELVNHIQELAPEKDKKKDKEPGVQDGEQASKEKPKKPPAPPKEKQAANKDPEIDNETAPGSAPDDAEEVPDAEDPADDELDPADDGNEGDDDRGDSKVADEIVGKRVQSITMEPKSKLVPGALELVITFDESPEPLKVIVTKTGQVKFYIKGGIHNTL